MKDITIESIRGQMKLPPQMQAAYKKIVAAGMKVIFDPSTRQENIEFLNGEGDFATKVGEGMVAVMLLLFKESNSTLPQQLIVPCGIELIVHVAEAAEKAGEPVDANVVAEAIGTFVEGLFKQMGVDPAQIPQMVSGMQSGVKPQGV